LLPTVKEVNAEGACREATKYALQLVVAERERCADAELRACESACQFAERGEAAAEAGRAEAAQRLSEGKQGLAAAQATLAGLREQLAALEAAEVAKGGRKKDTTVRTVEGLEKTDDELTKSWTNLEDAIKAEIEGDAARQLPTGRNPAYQLKKPAKLSTATAATAAQPAEIGRAHV
jgi:hypothetical protein